MQRYQEGLCRNYVLRLECQRKRKRWTSILQKAKRAIWNTVVMLGATYLILWEVVGFKQLAYMERGYDAIGGEYILIALVAIGIVKVADRWIK